MKALGRVIAAAVVACVVGAPLAAQAAESVHLYLRTAAHGAIQGDSTQRSLGRANSIECLTFKTGAVRDESRRAPTVSVTELVCRKAVDRATPLLLDALARGEVILGEARFFRPNPNGDGTTEHFYSVQGAEGRVVSVLQSAASVGDDANMPATELLKIRFPALTFTYQVGGLAAEVP